MQFVDQGSANMFNQPFCCECRHMAIEDGDHICRREITVGNQTLRPFCSTARDDVWFGKDACGSNGKFWEPIK